MKSKITNYLMAFTAVLFFSSLSFAQIEDGGNGNGPDPCPSNFPVTETFCFTNSSNYNFQGSSPICDGCDYQVCVKIKPKLSCFPNCNYASPDGYWSTTCTIISVGQTQCISIPSTSAPITDCWDVDITMKLDGQAPTLISSLENDYPMVGHHKLLSDHCLEGWSSALKRISGSGTYNFNITTYALLGQ
jgi:hypothetical protein